MQHVPCGFLTSHAQCRALTSAVMDAGICVSPRFAISLTRSVTVKPKQ